MTLLTISISLILFISAAGVLQAFLLAGLLYFHNRSDRSVASFLSLHILTISIFMLTPLAQYLIAWQYIVLLVPFQFLIGPFLYLYVRSFKESITWSKAWPHYILFAGFAVVCLQLYFNWVKKYPLAAVPPTEVLLAPVSYVTVITRNLQMLLYYLFAFRSLNSYQKSIQHLYSETSRISLSWIKWLLNGFLLLIITVFILFFLVVKYPADFSLFVLVNTAVITPYIYLVTIRGISQPTIWQLQPGKNKATIEREMMEAEKIDFIIKEQQPASKFSETIFRIQQLMEQEKLYREPELTLQALADKLRMPSYQVSRIINEGLQKNFYDLVNGYRVQEAQRLLLDPKNKNFTILSVGFEAGFNSKTTFNTVFKKLTGFTPTEYRMQ